MSHQAIRDKTRIFFGLHCYSIAYLGAHAKILNPTTIPSWVTGRRVRTPCEKIPLALMGVLAPGSMHGGPSAQPPIEGSGNFVAHWLPNVFVT